MDLKIHAPVTFLRIEVRPYLVEHVALYLKEIRRDMTGIGSNNIHDDPFLVLAMIQGCFPVLYLLPDGTFIRVAVLFEE
jgi:hypothetical protein